jgi:hypothetical protein
MSVFIKDGTPVVTEIDGHQYLVCVEPIIDENRKTYGYCGRLFEVTGQQIRADYTCGQSHLRDDNPILGVD